MAAYMDDGVEPVTVPSVQALSGGDAAQDAIRSDRDRPAEVLLAPAEAEHFVVGGPIDEGVVAAVPNIDAAALADEGFEVVAHGARPRGAAAEVVAGLDHHVVVREHRAPALPARCIRA